MNAELHIDTSADDVQTAAAAIVTEVLARVHADPVTEAGGDVG